MAKNQLASKTSTTSPLPMKIPQVPITPTTLDCHSLQIILHKLNGTNFREWSQSILLVVREKGNIGYLTRAILKPSPKAATYNAWEAENAIVMIWLVNSMEPKIGRTYLFYKTTSEIWKVVEEIYLDLKNIA